MSDGASRWLFLAEIVILALPGLVVMLIYALTVGGFGLVGTASVLVALLSGNYTTATEIWTGLGMAAVTLTVIAISIAGLLAIGTFVRIAVRFLRRGRAGFEAERGHFRRGLVYAAAPLAVMLPFGWLATQGDHPVDRVMGFYVSGLVLLPPVLHLWLELRRARHTA